MTLSAIQGLNVEIVSPGDGAVVPRVNVVKGNVSGLPSGFVLRVLVLPQSVGLWYPQQPIVLFLDSSWTTTVYVGDESSGAQAFLIGAMAVTEQQGRELDEDTTGCTQFVVNGPPAAVISVTRD